MAPRKILEGEIWCPDCRVYVGKIWRTEIRDGIYENETEPPSVPKKCSLCERILVRK